MWRESGAARCSRGETPARRRSRSSRRSGACYDECIIDDVRSVVVNGGNKLEPRCYEIDLVRGQIGHGGIEIRCDTKAAVYVLGMKRKGDEQR